jgi:cyclopropane fatty-acyl-phospholipid synthase-like methyltransferase
MDVGCGHGALLYFAKEAGYRNIKGVDISEQQVAAAARLGIDGVVRGDLLRALKTMRGESLDAVVTIDVIEHFGKEELLDLADEVFRVLRRNGRWIIHTVNGESPFFGRIRYGDFTHEQAFTRSSLQQIALSSEFTRVVCFEDVPIPHGIKSTIRWLLWKAITFLLCAWLIIETGAGSADSIFTQNLFAIVWK